MERRPCKRHHLNNFGNGYAVYNAEGNPMCSGCGLVVTRIALARDARTAIADAEREWYIKELES